jgi:hypothetical protein
MDVPVVRQVRRLGRALLVARAELAQSFAVLAGWGLVTHAIAQVAQRGPVWSLSAGLFCLSLAGWGWLANVARYGLYKLNDLERRRG